MRNFKQHEIKSIVDACAKIENIRLYETVIQGMNKSGWYLLFDYWHSQNGLQTACLITQRNIRRVWANINTAIHDIETLFPDAKQIRLLTRNN